MTNTNDNQLRLSKKYMKNANENIETLLQKMKEITEQQGYGNNSLTDYLQNLKNLNHSLKKRQNKQEDEYFPDNFKDEIQALKFELQILC